MNMIKNSLVNANKASHESSALVIPDGSTAVKGGFWVSVDELETITKPCQPVYMKDGKILMYPESHVLYHGSTGTGKSTVIYDNSIDINSRLPKGIRSSMIIFDVKGDLYSRHAKRLSERGFKVSSFNMRRPFAAERYNPLAAIYDDYTESISIKKRLSSADPDDSFNGKKYESYAALASAATERYMYLNDKATKRISEISETLINSSDPKNLQWADGARNCLRAILHTMLEDSQKEKTGMCREKFTLANMCRVAFSTHEDCKPLIQYLERSKHIRVVSGALGSCYNISAKITRDGYISSINSELNKLSSDSIGALTGGSEIDINELTSNEDFALFIITDDTDKASNSIGTMMLNDIINALIKKADDNPRHCLDKDVIVYADEFGNFPALPNMSERISTLRSRRIWLKMAIQSFEQLVRIYGSDTTSTIIENCDLQLMLGCNNAETKRNFCESMGMHSVPKSSVSIDAFGVATETVVTEDTHVVKCSDIDSLKLGEFFLKARGAANLKSFMTPYFLRDDVTMDSVSWVGKYNGFDPDENVYDIDRVLENEEEEEEEDSYSPPGRFFGVPSAPSRIEFETEIEKNLPNLGLGGIFLTGYRNIALNLQALLASELKEKPYMKNRLPEIEAEKIFPENMNSIIFDSPSTEPIGMRELTSCNDFLKKNLLYDPSLKVLLGKERVVGEFDRRLAVLKKYCLFGDDVRQAFVAVRNCINDMDDDTYCSYAQKFLETVKSTRR